MGMEGSRTNANVPKDEFQDYDVTYAVTDIESFKKEDKWLEYFGERIFMQKPEAMSLFPHELGNWFSYLYDDCCNEFWWVSTYVVKGLCRREILFTADHLNQIVRRELLRMISWKVGIETGFSLSVGKNYKYINKYINEDLWNRLLSTYRMDSCENIWESLFICYELFRTVSKEVSEVLDFVYPDYDKNITRYTENMYKKFSTYSY
ncbi:MAG: putative aminoglycoside 6-adenylyltransferase [Mahella sp.]|nr:putative aminoglycoside 6-adenylyltransferase [Mahella sp.]